MDGKNYSAVPPPPSLTASSKDAAPLNFNDALSKARAIAEKLKQQSSGGGSAISEQPVAAIATSGTKRGYYDDDREDSHPSYGATRSYGSYQDDRDSKRSAYDGGSSRPSYGSGNESRRYGLGSEERKPSYGGSTQHQEQYSVPNHMVGLLIGKGGENLKKIERVSGVHKVQFANDPVDGERPVYLSGEPDQVAIARDMIRQMVADASSNDQNRFSGGGSRHSDQAGGGSTLTIRIPMNKVGLVIGRGGETIRDFEERSKAKILIASDTGSERDNERVINLVGDDAAVQYAKSLIEDIVNGNNNTGGRNWGQQNYGGGYDQQQQGGYSHGSYGQGRMGRPDDERVFITVPASAVGLIIGRGGETVRGMQDQSGARVKIDPSSDPNSDERTVNISGDPKCVAIAKQLVEDKVAEASGSRGGRYGGRGGGYRSQNQDYGNDYNQHGGYQGSNEGGYDYSQQYSQYYAQYGYDQGQYNNGESGYQQYPGYQYNYQQEGNNEQTSGTVPAQSINASGAPPPPSTVKDGEDTFDENTTSTSTDKKDASSSSPSGNEVNQSAYYSQYYGGQQPTPEQQQAYYQWYQQYYGQQQQQQQQPHESSDQQYDSNSGKPETENVDGEPLDSNDKEDGTRAETTTST